MASNRWMGGGGGDVQKQSAIMELHTDIRISINYLNGSLSLSLALCAL